MPPLTVRQLTSAYELRYQNTSHVPHRDFSQGINRDIASWESPEGFMYDAVDVLCDVAGKVRKRGGTTSPAAGNSAATVENIVGFRSNSLDAITALFGSTGIGNGHVNVIDRTTGTSTSLGAAGSANVWAARPFQHQNFLVCSFQPLNTTSGAANSTAFVGGGTGTGFVVTAATVTGGDNRITGIAPSSLTAAHLGCIIELESAGNVYGGRIIEVTSSSAVRVEPTPVATTGTFTATTGQVRAFWQPQSGGVDVSGRYGVSYQNRIVLGGTVVLNANSGGGLKGIPFEPNTIRWSALPTESVQSFAGVTPDGNQLLFNGQFTGTAATPFYNFLQFPNLGGMTALATAGEGQLIVFGPTSTYRVTGQLDTETVQSPAFDFTSGLISSNVGCIAQRSIQYTRGGLVFAGFDNIYEYDGSSMRPLLTGRYATRFQARLRAGAKVLGSGYFINTNHYYLSLSDADSSLMLNLDTYAIVRETNVLLFDSTPDPSDATKLWGVRWWDTTGAAPTMTKGQLIGLESIFLPAQANASDADGTAVLPVIQTKSYMDGTLESNKLFTQLHVDYALQGTGSPTATVTADTKLNTSEASYAALTQGTLANTGTGSGVQHMDVTNQLAEGKAIEVKIALQAASAVFELNGINIGMQQRALT